MLRELIERAEKDKLALAPFIGIGSPGLIRDDGSIDRGDQNLPGNWEAETFNLPDSGVVAVAGAAMAGGQGGGGHGGGGHGGGGH
jgi:hypothetical protein